MSSTREDEILLEEMKHHPVLWMMSHPCYKDQRMRENFWYEIALKVGKPVSHCKKRWRNIKDTYDRKQHRMKMGSAAKPIKKGKKWALEEKLAFLKTTGEHQMTFSNLSETQNEFPKKERSPTQPSGTETLPTSIPILDNTFGGYEQCRQENKSRKENIADLLEERETEQQKSFRFMLQEQKEDDIDLFFKSLAKTVKKLPKASQQRAKLETLEVISRLERENWEPLQSSFSPSGTRTYSSEITISDSPDLKYENFDE